MSKLKQEQQKSTITFKHVHQTDSNQNYSSHIEKTEKSTLHKIVNEETGQAIRFDEDIEHQPQHWLIRNINLFNAPFTKFVAMKKGKKLKLETQHVTQGLESLIAAVSRSNDIESIEVLTQSTLEHKNLARYANKLTKSNNVDVARYASEFNVALSDYKSALEDKIIADKNKHFRFRSLGIALFVAMMVNVADEVDIAGSQELGYELANFDGGKGYTCVVHTFRVFQEDKRKEVFSGAESIGMFTPYLNMWLPLLSPLFTDEFVKIEDDHTRTDCSKPGSKDFYIGKRWKHAYSSPKLYSEWDFESIDKDYLRSASFKQLVSDVRGTIKENY